MEVSLSFYLELPGSESKSNRGRWNIEDRKILELKFEEWKEVLLQPQEVRKVF